MAGKEAVVVIIDVSKSMAGRFDGKQKLSIASEATRLLVQQKLLLSKTHEVGIILLGTEGTENELAENYGGYDHISILQELDVPSPDTLLLASALEASTVTGDILDAIVVAIQSIEAKIGKKKYKKRLFIITDGNCTANSPDQLQDIIDQINVQDVRVNVIAIGFGEEKSQNLTRQQSLTEEILTRLVTAVQGVIYPSNTAMQIYKQFRKRMVYPVAKYKGPLNLGLGFSIDVCVYGKTKEEPLPSLKKHSTVVEYAVDSKEALVKMSREAALEDDPTSTVVDPEDIIKAYYYGKSVVPVSHDDEELLKYPCRKCMKVLGYLGAAGIPRHYFMSGVDMVLPSPDNSHETAFAAFVQALYQRNDVVLIRYTYRENTNVRLAVLSPCIKPDLICLWLNILPTDEDVRNYPFPDLTASTDHQQLVTENFINALSLDKTDEQEEKLKPSSLFSPTLQYFYQCLTYRAEHPNGPLPPLDPNIENYLRPDIEMFGRARQACAEFANSFTLKQIEVATKEKKFYVDLLKGKPEESGPEEEGVTRIGDANPIEDFNAMIKDRKVDRVKIAIEQMQEYVLRLLDKDFKGNMHRKILECLRALRAGCIEEDETGAFNMFMAIKIRTLQAVHRDFWNLLVAEGVNLITSAESKDSKVTLQEAKAFLVKVESSQTKLSTMDLDEIE